MENLEKPRFCIECGHYQGEGVCGLAFSIALIDPVEGGKVENIPLPAANMRRGGHCGMNGIFWSEKISDEVKALRESIKD